MHKILLYILLLIYTVGCQPAILDDQTIPSATTIPWISQTDQVETVEPVQSPAILPQSTSTTPTADEAGVILEGDQMPIFLEMIQTTIIGGNSGQGPALDVGPTIYFYDSDNKVLSLNQAISVKPETELIIGIATILQTPNQEYTKREIIQFPAMQTTLMEVVAFDPESETITIIYENQKFDLSAGESRMFKQVDGNSQTPTVITQILNHGHLRDIQSVSPDGSWR